MSRDLRCRLGLHHWRIEVRGGPGHWSMPWLCERCGTSLVGRREQRRALAGLVLTGALLAAELLLYVAALVLLVLGHGAAALICLAWALVCHAAFPRAARVSDRFMRDFEDVVRRRREGSTT